MIVKEAKKQIMSIVEICEKAIEFDEKHPEFEEDLYFLCDAVGYLGDYKKMLARLIDEAELKI